MGDAIGLAIKRLQSQPEDQRTLILLTDGQDTASRVNPLKAAELAQSANVKIYTIGVGADIAYRRTMFGTMQVNPSRDLDEKTLKGIADKTGGDYFRARSTDELEAVYQAIDKLEPVEVEKKTYRPTSDLFYWPLAFFIILWLARHSPWRSVMRKRSALSQSEVSNNAG
jgi:Ca-activated chloride channel family protein